MILVVTIIVELTLLNLLSSRLGKTLYSIFWLILRNREAATAILTFIYLPGTTVHELAHLLTAEVLQVPTGNISFTPEVTAINSRQKEIAAGSVQIATTDPLRRFLIGFAPVIWGLGALMLLVWVYQYFWPQLVSWQPQLFLIVLIGYLMFAVSNNMFTSKSDMEGSQYFLPVAILVIAAFYFAGIRINLSGQFLILTNQLSRGLTLTLGIVIGVNIIILGLNSFILQTLGRLFHFKFK